MYSKLNPRPFPERKLDFEQRQRANNLEEWVIYHPTDACNELAYMEAKGKELEDAKMILRRLSPHLDAEFRRQVENWLDKNP